MFHGRIRSITGEVLEDDKAKYPVIASVSTLERTQERAVFHLFTTNRLKI